MSSLCEPGPYVVGQSPARQYEAFLQDRVAAAFAAHPDWITRDYDEVRPLIFSPAEIKEMAQVGMLIGCLGLTAAHWCPSVHITAAGEMVFYRAQMSGLWETGRYRDGKPVAVSPLASRPRSVPVVAWWRRLRGRG